MNRRTASAQIVDLAALRGRKSLARSLEQLDQAMATQRQAVTAFRATMDELGDEIDAVGRLWRQYRAEAGHLNVAPLRREAKRLAEIASH